MKPSGTLLFNTNPSRCSQHPGLSRSRSDAAALPPSPWRQLRTCTHPSWRRQAHIRVHLGGAKCDPTPPPRPSRAADWPAVARCPRPPPGGSRGGCQRHRRRSGRGRGAGMSDLRQRLGREPGGAREPEEKVGCGAARGRPASGAVPLRGDRRGGAGPAACRARGDPRILRRHHPRPARTVRGCPCSPEPSLGLFASPPLSPKTGAE